MLSLKLVGSVRKGAFVVVMSAMSEPGTQHCSEVLGLLRFLSVAIAVVALAATQSTRDSP